jgi:hypothetical protein
MRLSCAQAAKLLRLNSGQSLPRSQIPKDILALLQGANAVQLEQSGPSHVVRGVPYKVAEFAAQQWGITDLQRYANATPDNRSRELLAEIARDSKALPNQPFDGIFIRSFNNCYLGGQPLDITPQGAALLVTKEELPKLRIEATHLIAVENARCVWGWERARRYFPQVERINHALVLRWHWGNKWRQWLQNWDGQLLYFPDYDPAGMRIFVTEILPQRPTALLLIPQNLRQLLEQSENRELFLKQEAFLPGLLDHPAVGEVCQWIRRCRKVVEQEALLI